MAASTSGKQGFASMDADAQRGIARKGGLAQGKHNNPGNFANRPKTEAQRAGHAGGSKSRRTS